MAFLYNLVFGIFSCFPIKFNCVELHIGWFWIGWFSWPTKRTNYSLQFDGKPLAPKYGAEISISVTWIRGILTLSSRQQLLDFQLNSFHRNGGSHLGIRLASIRVDIGRSNFGLPASIAF